MDISLSDMKQSIRDILEEPNNHSKTPSVRLENIDKETFQRLMYHEARKLEEVSGEQDIEQTLKSMKNLIYTAARGARKAPQIQQNPNNIEDLVSIQETTIGSHNQREFMSWKNLVNTKDPKSLWEK
jgi:hypothetical protein